MQRLILFAASLMTAFPAVAQGPAQPGQAHTQWAPRTAAHACTFPPRNGPFAFWETCNNVRLNGCTLEASCRQKNRNVRYATLDTAGLANCHPAQRGGDITSMAPTARSAVAMPETA